MFTRCTCVALLFAATAATIPGQPPAPDVLTTLKGHTDTVDAVAVSPDGTMIATASFDKTAKLWDAKTGKELRTFGGEKGHTGQVLAVAFSADGGQLATGGADNFARVWGSPAGFPRARFGADAAILGVPAALETVGEFLPATEQLARRMKLTPDTPAASFQHPNLVDAVAFDDTGTLLATGCHDGNLRIFDLTKNAQLKQIAAHVQTMPQNVQHPIYCVAWTPDYKQILTTSYDKSMKLWDVASGNLVKEFYAAPNPKPIERPAEKKEEKKDEKKEPPKKEEKKDEKKEPPKKDVKKEPELTPPYGHRDQVFWAAFSKDGKFVATCSSDRTVKLWDVEKGRVVREFANPDLKPSFPDEPAPSHPGWVQGVRFTPDGKFLVTAGPAPRNKSYVAVWNVADGTRVFGAESEAIGPVQALALTADGKGIILGCAGKTRLQAEGEALIIKFPGK